MDREYVDIVTVEFFFAILVATYIVLRYWSLRSSMVRGIVILISQEKRHINTGFARISHHISTYSISIIMKSHLLATVSPCRKLSIQLAAKFRYPSINFFPFFFSSGFSESSSSVNWKIFSIKRKARIPPEKRRFFKGLFLYESNRMYVSLSVCVYTLRSR